MTHDDGSNPTLSASLSFILSCTRDPSFLGERQAGAYFGDEGGWEKEEVGGISDCGGGDEFRREGGDGIHPGNQGLNSLSAFSGKQIVDALSRRLSEEYGRGFSRPNLFHMIRFAETFPDREIVYALSRQLSWTHFRQIIYLTDPLQREFYTQMCRVERWSTRTLQDKIQGMLYERTAISRKPPT
jgi:hypothetical protein